MFVDIGAADLESLPYNFWARLKVTCIARTILIITFLIAVKRLRTDSLVEPIDNQFFRLVVAIDTWVVSQSSIRATNESATTVGTLSDSIDLITWLSNGTT